MFKARRVRGNKKPMYRCLFGLRIGVGRNRSVSVQSVSKDGERKKNREKNVAKRF